ncbi:hypothetical protein [Flavobacterium sp. DG2-3]|uniref:hypothetical protein n=1 Tax=Flavobacterium sp. DG2-3 TaxID=3068317 RepID=UPI00273DD986|nr:hypothetical protein [Flavobacterium sp. DG2-3]MDP5200082.1 hypothetical protein [Flavobacterium sp. DG2-3]
MTNSTQKTSLPKIYSTTALVAYIYAVFTIVFLVYKEFFYVDQTWFHGLMANGLAVISTFVWFGILIVFKLFLNQILHYKKADSLIIAYLVFLGISIYSVGKVLLDSILLFMSLGSGDELNASMAFASTSFSGVIWLMLSTVVMILITILLGNRIRKITIVHKNLFKILGFSLIVLGVCSALELFRVVESEIIVFLPKAFVVAVLGYILNETSKMEIADLPSLPEPVINNVNHSKANVAPQNESVKAEKAAVLKKSNEAVSEQIIIPNVDLNELENKEAVFSYFENLSRDEINRLEIVVSKKYDHIPTGQQLKNLIIYHIAEKRLYDHNRYAPQ